MVSRGHRGGKRERERKREREVEREVERERQGGREGVESVDLHGIIAIVSQLGLARKIGGRFSIKRPTV